MTHPRETIVFENVFIEHISEICVAVGTGLEQMLHRTFILKHGNTGRTTGSRRMHRENTETPVICS